MTLEDMARAIQGDLARMGGDILTLGARMDDGFKKVRNEIADVRDDVVRMNGIMVSKGELAETFVENSTCHRMRGNRTSMKSATVCSALSRNLA